MILKDVYQVKRELTEGNGVFSARNCEGYPGGLKGLSEELKAAVRKGIDCLMKSGASSQEDAIKLIGILENESPVLVSCGKKDQVIGKDETGDPVVMMGGV